MKKLLTVQLTAAILDLNDFRTLTRWERGVSSPREVDRRLRFTYHLAAAFSEHVHTVPFSVWLNALNPRLMDRSPLTLLRGGDLDVVGPKLLLVLRALIDKQARASRT